MSTITQTRALLPTWLRALLPAESKGELSSKTVGHFQHYVQWKAAVFAVFDHDEYWCSLSDTSSCVVQSELRAIRSHIDEHGNRVYEAVAQSGTRSVADYYTLLVRVVLGNDEFQRVMAGSVDVSNRASALGEAYGKILISHASEVGLLGRLEKMKKLFWGAHADTEKLVETWLEDTAAAVRPHLAEPHDRARVFTRWEHAYAHLMKYRSNSYNMGPAELYWHLPGADTLLRHHPLIENGGGHGCHTCDAEHAYGQTGGQQYSLARCHPRSCFFPAARSLALGRSSRF